MTSSSTFSIGWWLKLALAVLCFAASPVIQGQQSVAGEESETEAREQQKALPERQKLVYEVEMLIFENLEAPGLSRQKWPEKSLIPSLDGLTRLPPEAYVRDPEPSSEAASETSAQELEKTGDFLGGRRGSPTAPQGPEALSRTLTAALLNPIGAESVSLTKTIVTSEPKPTKTNAADDNQETSTPLTDAEINFSRLQATLTLDASLEPMPRNQLSFLDIKKSMEESPHYRILAHLGWLTPKPVPGAFAQYHLSGGERWLLEASSSEVTDAASAVKSLLHASSRALDGTREQISPGYQVFATRALNGRFWIIARRFFHFNAELVLTQKRTRRVPILLDATADGDSAEATETAETNLVVKPSPTFMQSYSLNLKRRLRRNELHLIDHPKLGILIRIRRIQRSRSTSR